MTTKPIKLLALFSIFTIGLTAQDIHFSQFNEAPLMINPANTGLIDGYSRAIINYRNQWSSAGSPFKTMAASFDSEIGLKKQKNAYLGVGGFIFQDKAGAANWSQFNADVFLNAVVKMGKASHLALAVGGGYVQNSANFNSLSFGNQYNGDSFTSDLSSQETIVFKKFNYADVSSGINYEFDKSKSGFDHNSRFAFKMGVAAYHLNRPALQYATTSKERLDPRYVGNMSARFDFKDTKLSFLPSVVYMTQGKASQVNAGGFLRMRFSDQTKITGTKHENSIYFGLFTRIGDAFIPKLMVQMSSFNVGFSYDYNFSSYKAASKGVGGFEVSLRWTSMRDGLFKQKREFGDSKSGASSSPTP